MSKYLKILIPFIIIFFAIGYDCCKAVIFPPKPCVDPILYSLGSFDAKFNISKEYFLSALADAEKVWEGPSHIDLFAYSPQDTDSDVLKVNLIYDYRQQATSKLKSVGIVVNENKGSYDSLKSQFEKTKNSYESQKAQFEAKLAEWNRGPRTDKTEFEELQAMQRDLNNKVDEINSLVVVINRLAATLNLSVGEYNTINGSRGESFEEGVFHVEGSTKEIDIYEFSNRAKLVRVLAHELGHALGLGHVKDPKAIMYEFNQGSSVALSVADLAALSEKCGAKFEIK